jgi:hypothetical protein
MTKTTDLSLCVVMFLTFVNWDFGFGLNTPLYHLSVSVVRSSRIVEPFLWMSKDVHLHEDFDKHFRLKNRESH